MSKELLKKIISILIIMVLSIVLIGCQEKRDALIPVNNPEYIVFYNGGTIIYEAFIENGEITVTAEKYKTLTISFGDTTEYWLVYSITQDGKTTNIVDSDTLSIVWY